MKQLWILFFGALLFATACKNENKTTEEADAPVEAYLGEIITPDGAISYDDLLSQLEEQDSVVNVKVEGKVDGVCQAKGCWMNIVSAQEGAESMFVKFTDYAFFMPKDLSGETIIMKGKAYKEATSVEELRHYAEDEGKSEEEIMAITEPITELKFMADGVILKDRL